MVKNALEAVKSGDYVELRFDREDGAPVFSVWNRGAIPEHIASRVFQRSFSTKGESGRGIGTYSMRLIGQQYLGGIVDFISSPDDGTTFSIVLPLTLRHAGAPKSGSV